MSYSNHWLIAGIVKPLVRAAGAIAVGVGLAVLLTTYNDAVAFGRCGNYKDMRAALEGPKYLERLQGRGLTRGGYESVELFASSSPAGTFTVLTIRADGIACVTESGIAWAVLAQPIAGQDI